MLIQLKVILKNLLKRKKPLECSFKNSVLTSGTVSLEEEKARRTDESTDSYAIIIFNVNKVLVVVDWTHQYALVIVPYQDKIRLEWDANRPSYDV